MPLVEQDRAPEGLGGGLRCGDIIRGPTAQHWSLLTNFCDNPLHFNLAGPRVAAP